VEVAHIVHLGQRHERLPVEGERIVHESTHFELPCREAHIRLLSEIEDRPVFHHVLTNREFGHAVMIRGTGALRWRTAKPHVHRSVVELDLPLDVLLATFNKVGH
jgi:hypothetical protein